jgi:hypothetical protein
MEKRILAQYATHSSLRSYSRRLSSSHSQTAVIYPGLNNQRPFRNVSDNS